MAHVTFVHGLANKPSAEDLHNVWRRAILNGGLDLAGEGVTTEMVYWADVLYDAPLAAAAQESSVALEAQGEVTLPDADTPEEIAFVEGLASKLDSESPPSPSGDADPTRERIPLPWAVKRPLMRRFIRDAHHYLFNVEHSPRSGVTYRVQSEIRDRFVRALTEAPSLGPHVVVAHSLGSVIAYDALARVPGCPPVDALITLGSPLGIDEVQDRLRPGWSRPDGFPRRAIRGSWVNVYDPFDPVALDPRLGNDFREAGRLAVEDVEVSNTGLWRHDLTDYASQPSVVGRLTSLLFQ